jgi:hypothetical protein
MYILLCLTGGLCACFTVLCICSYESAHCCLYLYLPYCTYIIGSGSLLLFKLVCCPFTWTWSGATCFIICCIHESDTVLYSCLLHSVCTCSSCNLLVFIWSRGIHVWHICTVWSWFMQSSLTRVLLVLPLCQVWFHLYLCCSCLDLCCINAASPYCIVIFYSCLYLSL